MKKAISYAFWEKPSKLVNGYMPKEELKLIQENTEEPTLFPEIRDGKIVAWRPIF